MDVNEHDEEKQKYSRAECGFPIINEGVQEYWNKNKRGDPGEKSEKEENRKSPHPVAAPSREFTKLKAPDNNQILQRMKRRDNEEEPWIEQ